MVGAEFGSWRGIGQDLFFSFELSVVYSVLKILIWNCEVQPPLFFSSKALKQIPASDSVNINNFILKLQNCDLLCCALHIYKHQAQPCVLTLFEPFSGSQGMKLFDAESHRARLELLIHQESKEDSTISWIKGVQALTTELIVLLDLYSLCAEQGDFPGFLVTHLLHSAANDL